MIRIVCFKWHKPHYRSKFTGEHVNILRDMVARNTTVPHEFVCVTDDPTGIDEDIRVIPIWDNPAPQYGAENKPNCFVRLKCFSDEMKQLIGEKFLWIDLDVVIVNNIDHILNDPAQFKIWRVDGEMMPCNGSLALIEAGSRSYIWDSFKAEEVDPVFAFRRGPERFVGSDQAWIAKNLREEDQFFGQKDGVYSFRCHVEEEGLKPNACIIFFHGERDPWMKEIQEGFDWVRTHYRQTKGEVNAITRNAPSQFQQRGERRV